MWNFVCSNRICFDIDKSREQNLHLERLLTIKPTMNSANRPKKPDFLQRRGPQIEKQKQIQDKINYENQLVKSQINEIYSKPGKYCQQPPQQYPAFRRYGPLKYNEAMKLIKIYESNLKFQNKIQTCRPSIDNKNLMKDAENQERYLFNLLNRPKSIPITPSLNFLSIEQVKNRINNQILYAQQEYYNNMNRSKSQTKGTSAKRGGSAKKSSNNSKLNKSQKSNKSGNKVSRSQSAKKQKALNIDDVNKMENNKANIKENKKETTTKNTTNKC